MRLFFFFESGFCLTGRSLAGPGWKEGLPGVAFIHADLCFSCCWVDRPMSFLLHAFVSGHFLPNLRGPRAVFCRCFSMYVWSKRLCLEWKGLRVFLDGCRVTDSTSFAAAVCNSSVLRVPFPLWMGWMDERMSFLGDDFGVSRLIL